MLTQRHGGLLLIVTLAIALAAAGVITTVSATHLLRPQVGVWSPTYNTWNITIPLLNVGAVFDLTVNVTEVNDLAGYDVLFKFNRNLITIVNPCVNGSSDPCDESNELTLADAVLSGPDAQDLAVEANDLLAQVRVARVLLGAAQTFSGSGFLLRVPFKVVGIGSTDITLTCPIGSWCLLDSFSEPIPHDSQNGKFNNTGRQPPEARFSWTWDDTIRADGKITAGETVKFNATDSFAEVPEGTPNNGIAKYQWVWGDGTSFSDATQPLIEHVFRDGQGRVLSGTFAVKLTVTDVNNLTDEETQNVAVSSLPTHGVSVFIEISPQTIRPRDPVHLRVNVNNLSTDFTETVNFTVTVDRLALSIWSEKDIVLEPISGKDFEFDWTNTDLEPGGYTIRVRVPSVPGETNVSDNDAFQTLDIELLVGSSLPFIGYGIIGLLAIGGSLYMLKRLRGRRREEELE